MDDYEVKHEEQEEPVQENKEPEKGNKKMNALLEWVMIIAIALAAALFINFVLIINSVVPSGSMETTIMTGSRMMGLRVTYWFSDPKQGDIIVFKYPDDPSENFVKRVIGTPGDVVEIREKARSSQHIKDILEYTADRGVPAWLSADPENFKGTVSELPSRDQIDVPVDELAIVELYSK